MTQTFVAVVILSLCSAVASADTSPVDLSGLEPLDTFQDCDLCPQMIVLPAGSFMMGAIIGESRNPFDAYGPDATGRRRGPDEVNIIPNEHPRHRVEMDIRFAIARNEVTHAEWMACVDDGGCDYEPDHRVFTPNGYRALGPNHPAINVSYLDVLKYVAWLNDKVGAQVYRLPTEAEWEYAARAGTQPPFAQGEELTVDQANFSRAATENILGVSMPLLVDQRGPVPVDELDAANAWGLRHMSGNVYELTMSCWSDEHLSIASDQEYLIEARSRSECRRVAKGGAFNIAMDGLRPAARIRPAEDRRRDWIGFRIVRELDNTGGE